MNSLKIIGITTMTLLASSANAMQTQRDYGPTLKLDYEIAAKAYRHYTPVSVNDLDSVSLEKDAVVVPITRGCVSLRDKNALVKPTTTMNVMGKVSCAKIFSTFPSSEMTFVPHGECIAGITHPEAADCSAVEKPLLQAECQPEARGTCTGGADSDTTCSGHSQNGKSAACIAKTVTAVPEVDTYTLSEGITASGGNLIFTFNGKTYTQGFTTSATKSLTDLVGQINHATNGDALYTAAVSTAGIAFTMTEKTGSDGPAPVGTLDTGSIVKTNGDAVTVTHEDTTQGFGANPCTWEVPLGFECVYSEPNIGTKPNFDSAGGDSSKYTDATGCGCLSSYTFHPPSAGVIGCAQSVVWYNSARDHIVGTVAAAVNAKSTSIGENYDLEQLQQDAARAISDATQVASLCSELQTSLRIKRNTYHAYNSAWSDMTLIGTNTGITIPALKGTRNRNREIAQEKILAHALGQGHETEVLMNLLTLA